MSNTRLVTVIRKDIGLSDGQLAAQSSHIADNWIRTRLFNSYFIKEGSTFPAFNTVFSKKEFEWMNEPYIAVLAVNTKEEIDYIFEKAKGLGLLVHSWSDILPSKVLNGQMVKYERIGISIGPDDSDKIKEVTGTLPLY